MKNHHRALFEYFQIKHVFLYTQDWCQDKLKLFWEIQNQLTIFEMLPTTISELNVCFIQNSCIYYVKTNYHKILPNMHGAFL